MLEIDSYILIIEDESDIRELIAYHLEKNSFSVKQAKSAEEALPIINEQKPIMIILDLMLPKMSGLELCHKLKKESQTQDIPILMLTAKSEKEDIIKGLEMGADDYVTKPFDVREVVARVRALLRRKTSAHELGQ
ncbi:MAG TPA: response regulator, partial [Bdellovibrionota bacterium]|nr:response regulator [Bdellovibrionota bacterium]